MSAGGEVVRRNGAGDAVSGERYLLAISFTLWVSLGTSRGGGDAGEVYIVVIVSCYNI
jgi:hypothetical protein